MEQPENSSLVGTYGSTADEREILKNESSIYEIISFFGTQVGGVPPVLQVAFNLIKSNLEIPDELMDIVVFYRKQLQLYVKQARTLNRVIVWYRLQMMQLPKHLEKLLKIHNEFKLFDKYQTHLLGEYAIEPQDFLAYVKYKIPDLIQESVDHESIQGLPPTDTLPSIFDDDDDSPRQGVRHPH